ncbi:bacterial alpha-L-rhamnosidase-domain-containing protein [Xylariales sp. PMI_506]|nr:bacterial alpha-L-rhamnosidase-domain-containing protein [Xylariales sp. PMI_506]
MSVSIAQVSAEHHHSGFGLFSPTPRLSWRFSPTTVKDWRQASYDIVVSRGEIVEEYHVDSSESILVPWPSSPLSSRESGSIKVRATGKDGIITDWAELRFEVALLELSDWKANMISGPEQDPDEPKVPFRLRREFTLERTGIARLYATAHGIYEVEINGKRVGDELLSPGWQSYHHRLHYQTYDITSLLQKGANVIGIYLGEGWYAGRIGWGTRNLWGKRLGFFGQLEIDGEILVASDDQWEHLDGPVLASEIYDGEIWDSNLEDVSWSTPTSTTAVKGRASILPTPSAKLISPDVAPVRRIMELKAQELIVTPKGKKILDFGQNLTGWLRIEKDIPGQKGDELLIRHAEVLENGELGTRPLRKAEAREIIKLGGRTKGYEPRFTFHGFRYAEINGYEDVGLEDFTAIVISSDVRRTGAFQCSHKYINRLHENTVWSTRGNFISLPTDCPQRDERLGWTGDIQVFAPTANFLFDTSAFLGSWLQDLAVEQANNNGIPPVIIPAIPMGGEYRQEKRPMAVWADAAVITPWDLYTSFGDTAALERQWESITAWLDRGVPRDPSGFYNTESPQYADWLDPRSPPELPGHCPTDPFLVANAYLVHTTKLAAVIARVLGKSKAAQKYDDEADKLLKLFQNDYISPSGRAVCDTQTAYALLLSFGLFDDKHLEVASRRLAYLTKWESFQITTGFAGTPLILHALADNGMLNLAYRMLQARDDPSWLYPVRMGATTIWERWNSMLPDGSINPGQMTSFNHYALGSVCSFLHKTVGGLSSVDPGWKTALVKPLPGGTVTSADTSFDSPYGPYEVSWKVADGRMITKVAVPPNGQARVVVGSVDVVTGSGQHSFDTKWEEDLEWPPEPILGPERLKSDAHWIP